MQEMVGYNTASSGSIVSLGSLIMTICGIIILFIFLFLLSWLVQFN